MNVVTLFFTVVAGAAIGTMTTAIITEKMNDAHLKSLKSESFFRAQNSLYDIDAIDAWNKVIGLRSSKAQGWDINEGGVVE